MIRRVLPLLVLVAIAPAALAGLPKKPNQKEWTQIQNDYTWLETLRKSAPKVPDNASRKQQIEMTLESLKKLEPVYMPFLDKLREYYDRTHDLRAAKLYATEKIKLGDVYMNTLSRYDRAITMYNSALAVDPENEDAKARIAVAEGRRFIAMDVFGLVRKGMKELDVRQLVGTPREDWIKQVIQKGRVFSVWIYPKVDGGAAAIYFDNGVVYHTNWNAATAAAEGQSQQNQAASNSAEAPASAPAQ